MGKLQLVQTVVDPVTGGVLYEPGEVFDEKNKVVKLAGVTAFRPVEGDAEPHAAPEPEPVKQQPKATDKPA